MGCRKRSNIHGTFLSWLSNFVCDRTFQTRINSSLSPPENLLSGVIQGSDIGPILFVIFINDLIDALQRFGVSVKLFADDAKVYICVLNNCDVLQLQCALDALKNWEHMCSGGSRSGQGGGQMPPPKLAASPPQKKNIPCVPTCYDSVSEDSVYCTVSALNLVS